MKQSVSASCGLGTVYVCFCCQGGHAWGGSYDEETSSSWDLVFYEESRI